MPVTLDRTIARPPEDVWRIMTDWKIAEYWLGVNRLRPNNPSQAPGVGMLMTYRVRGEPHDLEITDWVPRQRLGLATRQGGLTVHYRYRLEDNESGTRVVLVAEVSADKWPWKAVAPLLQATMRWSDRKQLQALENLVRITTGSGQ